MDDEILVKNNNRVGKQFLMWLILGLIVFFLMTGGEGLLREAPFWVAALTCILIIDVFAIHSLRAGKPYLETSARGISLGSGIQKRIPWRNIQDIGFLPLQTLREMWGGKIPRNPRLFTDVPPQGHPLIAIHLHDADDIEFDSIVHRAAFAVWPHFSVIRLNPQMAAAVNVEALHGQLMDRWQRAMAEAGQNKAPQTGSGDAGDGAK